MKAFIDRLMNAARKFTVSDFASLKITLISIGIILGVYFAEFFRSYLMLLWIVFLVSYVWIIYRTFVKHMK